MPRFKPSNNVYKDYLDCREMGILGKSSSGFLCRNRVIARNYKNLLKSIEGKSHNFPNVFEQSSYSGKYSGEMGLTGGIFNLEFNPDGSLLAAACERRNVLLFDPNSRKLVNAIENAHEDCVNCVRFLDSRSFATCSDDTTVALWDARYLKYKVRTLKGHSNWVKNIEYSFKENLLVTSGFDGAIYTWDINKYTENDGEFVKVFYTNGLMRMRLTPDANQMVISTMNGFIMIIHDLNLTYLQKDLNGFKPNMYRLLQLSNKPIPIALNYTHLFHTKRNRVEIISDFAPGNDAEIISSLQIHPQGWVAVSRNISSDDRSEWCCVHDIHPYPTQSEDDEIVSPPQSRPLLPPPSSSSSSSSHEQSSNTGYARLSDFLVGLRPSSDSPIVLNVRPRSTDIISRNYENESIGNDIFSAAADGYSVVEMLDDLQSGFPGQSTEGNGQYLFITPSNQNGTNRLLYFGTPSLHRSQNLMPKDPRIHRNLKRLTHFLEETNTGRGFIKEVSFSSDGRVIASPYGFGVRLLSFDSQISELHTCLSSEEKQLLEVGTVAGRHNEVVLSSAFSPHHFLLVSGCLAGRIAWYQPVL